jgi:GT2 family glycosyltransferase
MEASNIALIVCTRNRPEYIEGFINRYRELAIFPGVLIFVDSSDNQDSAQLILTAANDFQNKVHYIKSKPGLPFQRNVGIDLLLSKLEFEKIEIVSFTDDDCLLSSDYFGAIIKSFATLPNCVGVTGLMSPIKPPEASWIHEFFGLRSKQNGKILKSGLTTSPIATTSPEIVEWMPGGSMNIAKEIFSTLRFDSSLRMYGEDLKMALGLARFGRMYVVPEARITHLEAQSGKDPHYKVILHTDAIRWQLSEEFPEKIKQQDIIKSIIGEIVICSLNLFVARFPGRQFDTIRAHILFLCGVLMRKENVQRNRDHSG